MFIPGETITHRFIIPFYADDITKVIVSYKQKEGIVFEKTITSGFVSEGYDVSSFSYEFTQPEGLLFADNTAFTIQVNVYTKFGTRHSSVEIKGENGVQYVRDIIKSS